MGPLMPQGKPELTTDSLACLLPKAGGKLILHRGYGEWCVQGLGCRGGLGVLLARLGGVLCRRHTQSSAFAPNTLSLLQAPQKLAVGLFGLFVSFGSRICPNCACAQLLLVPCSFFVFCCSKRDVSRCRHCSIAARVPGL